MCSWWKRTPASVAVVATVAVIISALLTGPAGAAPLPATVVRAGGETATWVVTESGRVATSGAARFHGELQEPPAAPIVMLAPTPTGEGYHLLAADGAVYSFGDAQHHGTLSERGVTTDDATFMKVTRDGGYWISLVDGRWFGFGPSAATGTDPVDDPGGDPDEEPSAAPGEQVGDDPDAGLAWPVPGLASSEFGYRRHPVYGGSRMHDGLDLDAAHGEPVAAAGTGTVAFAGWRSGYGQTVEICHDAHRCTLSAHLSTVGVAEGETVTVGQEIGLAGSTGLSTGPHLHFEVRIDGEPVDPREHLPAR